MTSIPVRKGTGIHLKRRNKDEGHSPPHDESENKNTKTKTMYNSREDNGKHISRPLTRKELAEENDTLKSEMKDHEHRLKELEALLRLEKDKVSSLKKDSSKKETEYKENLDDMTKRSGNLETRLESYETKLLKCNIDPVTLDSLEPCSKDSESETRYEQTLMKVRLIKDKFNEFNLQALQNIDNLQVMNNQLDEVLTNCQSITSQASTTREHTNLLDDSNDSVYY